MTATNPLTTGVFPAIVTPFTDDGRIDHETLAAEVNRLETAGVDGIVPVGSTGESATLTHAEHVEVVETVVATTTDIPVIAGTGSNSTHEAVELSHGAAGAGADGLLLISPYYNNPEPAGMAAHYRAIADAVDCPQILYNVPGRTGRSMAVETICELATHDRIIGLKAASGDLGRISEVIERTQEADFAVLAGDDGVTLPIMSIGGTGSISVAANVAPAKMSSLVAAALAEDYPVARRHHHELGPLFRTLFVETNPIPVKTALGMLGHVNPQLRSPLSDLSEEHRELLVDVLADLDLPTGPRQPV